MHAVTHNNNTTGLLTVLILPWMCFTILWIEPGRVLFIVIPTFVSIRVYEHHYLLSFCLSVLLFLSLYFCLSLRLSICLGVYLSINLSGCLSIFSSVCPSVHLSKNACTFYHMTLQLIRMSETLSFNIFHTYFHECLHMIKIWCAWKHLAQA